MDKNTFFNTVILTATVFAALITSIVNIAISLINNHRLKNIEKQKQMNEIDKYRYSRLYELVLNWHKYDSDQVGKTVEEIAFYRLLHSFMDDSARYEIAKPLLDKCYIDKLEIKKSECDKLLSNLIEAEASGRTHSDEFSIIKQKYFDNGADFSKILKEVINHQLEVLLNSIN